MSRSPLVHDSNQVQHDTKIDIENTGVKMGNEIFNTDLHWYHYFIGRCYNTDECRVENIRLQHNVVPGPGYMLYYTLLGNPGMLYRVQKGCCCVMFIRAIFIFLYMNQFALFYNWDTSSIEIKVFIMVVALIYILLGIPANILRYKAIKLVNANDAKLTYERLFDRMIPVDTDSSMTSLNEFYEINIQSFYSTLQSRGITYQEASIFIGKLTQVQARATIKFMIYQPQWKHISDEAHSDLNSIFSYLNYAFPLVTLFQLLILGLGAYFWVFVK